jgi:DNA mismatch repair protein MutS2
MLEQAKDQAKRTVQENRDKIIREAAELHKAIREAQSELRKEKSKERIEQARKVLTAIEKQMESGIWKPEEGQAGEELSEEGGIRVGDVVWLKESNVPATVLAVFRKKNQVEVQAGAAKVTIGLDKVERVASRSEIKLARSRPVSLPATKVVSPQLDLRGKRADDVEPILDSYLSDAVLSNLSEVRIVHGFGTGTVRNIVRDFLAAHPMVKAFRSGRDNEGGDGVTIVSL